MSKALSSTLAALDDASLETAEELTAALHHDVGKYVSRVARNVKPGEAVPSSLCAMLAKDLYETHQGTRASARFDALAAELPAALASLEALAEARAGLARIDALEVAVRGGDAGALSEAVAEARALEEQLARLVRAVRTEGTERSAASPGCMPAGRRGDRDA